MKTITFFLSAALPLMLCDSFKAAAQTYVSGGIYSNTTWTFANSPYIVTGNVVVFPGFTLTIEPGVTIRFDNSTSLEVRQATLAAVGTSTGNITFTSNSANPVPGMWGGIWINGNSSGTMFNHCIIEYSTTAVECYIIAYIKNSIVSNNNEGVNHAYFPIDSCRFTNNLTGISNLYDDISYCTFKQNNMGIEYLNGSQMMYCTLDSNLEAISEISSSYLSHCSISYNTSGIRTHVSSRSRIESCVFNYNSNYGLLLQAENDTIFDCDFFYNSIGLSLAGHASDGGSIVLNSDFKFNTTGISVSSNFGIPSFITQCVIEDNATGILVSNTNVSITCNRICNNTSYNLAMGGPSNFSVAGNEWCTTDSASTAVLILDGYDNVAYGLVTFLPMDTLGCSPNTQVIPINQKMDFTVYPNPTSSTFTISQSFAMQNSELKIFNAMGEIVYSDKTGTEDEYFCHPNLSPGFYTIQLNKDDQSGTCTLVIVEY